MATISLNKINQLIFVMEPRYVFFEIETEFLNYLDELQYYHFAVLNQKIKIPPSLSQALTLYHHNVFTVILPLSEGQAGKAWEPSKKMMLFLPPDI
jgi:hypothetical protein